MAEPITKALDEGGAVLHDCTAARCPVSWDGYVLVDGYVVEEPDPVEPGQVTRTPLAKGARVPNAKDPGKRWDLSQPGIAKRRPLAG